MGLVAFDLSALTTETHVTECGSYKYEDYWNGFHSRSLQRFCVLSATELFQEDLMSHRPASPPEYQPHTGVVEDGDDSIEFAEFTGDDASANNAAIAEVEDQRSSDSESPSETSPPEWFRSRSESHSEAQAGEKVDAPALDVVEASVSDRVESRQRKRKKSGNRIRQRSEKTATGAALIETADEEPEQLDWRKDWKKLATHWLISNASCGYGVSLIVHTVLLAVMSAIVYHSMDDNQSISMIITDADAMPVEFTEIMDLTMEPAGSSQNQLPQLQQIQALNAEAELSVNPFDAAGQVAGNDGDGGDTDEGFGFQFSMPEGGKVVSKGSFSAWTVPEDPEPYQRYMIVIRIRLPENTKTYRIADLSGKVEGNDYYVQHLPFDPNRKDLIPQSERRGQVIKLRTSSRLSVIKNHVQIMIPVKGGASLVRDTIQVKSRMLKEDQRLEIVF